MRYGFLAARELNVCAKFQVRSSKTVAATLRTYIWMDGMARLGDGCRQVPRTACYQDNVLFIVMLQGSAATALSPSDLSIIQPAHECTASGLQV